MSNGRSNLVDIDCIIIGETDKAYRIDAGDGEPVWIPKSQCEWDPGDKTMAMPTWVGGGTRTDMKICSVEGCLAKHLAKGVCSAHYQRLYKRGTLETTVMRGASPVARILAKITIQANGCWLFTGGTITSNGYGHIRVGRTMKTAHVIMYQDKYGPVPEGMELDHFFCQQKACCNPDHVEPVTHLENTKRSVAQKTAEHGAWGFGRWNEDKRKEQARNAANIRWGKGLI